MKKKDSNILVFKPEKTEAKDLNETAEILNMQNVILMRNASLITREKHNPRRVDILVSGERIAKIEPSIKDVPPRTDEFDLEGDFVMPLFINAFEQPKETVEEAYGVPEPEMQDVFEVNIVKSLTAGTFLFAPENDEFFTVIDNISKLSENQLSRLSDKAAKKNKTVFLRVGQTLDELGQIDKAFHKPLSQVLEDFGFLDRRFVIVGGNCFDKDDWQLFAEYGATAVVCPLEDAREGRRPVNLRMLKDLGVNVILGSGRAETIDFFEYMRQVVAMQRCMFEEQVISEREVYEMATGGDLSILSNLMLLDAHEYFGLSEGCYANFCVVRKEVIFHDDPIKHFVWEKNRRDVMMTVLHGEITQVCGLVCDNETMHEQNALLSAIARDFAKKRIIARGAERAKNEKKSAKSAKTGQTDKKSSQNGKKTAEKGKKNSKKGDKNDN